MKQITQFFLEGESPTLKTNNVTNTTKILDCVVLCSFEEKVCENRMNRSGHRRCFLQKVFVNISQNSQENICARVSFLINFLFFKKETLAQVFSCEFCEIFNNTFFKGCVRYIFC